MCVFERFERNLRKRERILTSWKRRAEQAQ